MNATDWRSRPSGSVSLVSLAVDGPVDAAERVERLVVVLVVDIVSEEQVGRVFGVVAAPVPSAWASRPAGSPAGPGRRPAGTCSAPRCGRRRRAGPARRRGGTSSRGPCSPSDELVLSGSGSGCSATPRRRRRSASARLRLRPGRRPALPGPAAPPARAPGQAAVAGAERPSAACRTSAGTVGGGGGGRRRESQVLHAVPDRRHSAISDDEEDGCSCLLCCMTASFKTATSGRSASRAGAVPSAGSRRPLGLSSVPINGRRGDGRRGSCPAPGRRTSS